MNIKLNTKLFTLVAFILTAALSRLLPHPPNFTPIAAIALFGGAYFSNRYLSIFVTLSAMLVSDAILGFHSGMIYVYSAFAVISVLGFYLREKVNVMNVTLSSLAGSVVFFLVTNFGVWAGWDFYSRDLGGLLQCYAAGIPFFGNTVAGDLFYVTIMFGAFELAKRKVPALAVS